jgi:hypothetical protein
MNIKRAVEKLKVEKEDADAEKQTIDPAEFRAYVWELLGKAQRGELPPATGNRNRQPQPVQPATGERVWLNKHLEIIASRMQTPLGEGEKVQIPEVKTDDEADDLDTSNFLSWVRNRYRI